MHVLVLGAGLAGVTSAWYLKQAGFDVTVVDRQPAPAMETSFANGGQISASHPEPWANPGAPLTGQRRRPTELSATCQLAAVALGDELSA